MGHPLGSDMLEVGNKTDNSGFQSGFDENPKIKVLSGIGMHCTSAAPTYPVGMSASSLSFLSSSHLVTWNETVSGVSFDQYVHKTAG